MQQKVNFSQGSAQAGCSLREESWKHQSWSAGDDGPEVEPHRHEDRLKIGWAGLSYQDQGGAGHGISRSLGWPGSAAGELPACSQGGRISEAGEPASHSITEAMT